MSPVLIEAVADRVRVALYDSRHGDFPALVVDGYQPPRDVLPKMDKRMWATVIEASPALERSVLALAARQVPQPVCRWLVSAAMAGRYVRVETWHRLPQPDPELRMHVLFPRVRVTEVDNLVTAVTEPGTFTGHAIRCPAEGFEAQQQITDVPWPDLTPPSSVFPDVFTTTR